MQKASYITFNAALHSFKMSTYYSVGECVFGFKRPVIWINFWKTFPFHDPALFQTEFILSTLKPTGHLIVGHQKTHQPSSGKILRGWQHIPSTSRLHICLPC
ncbi:hypothetical protein CEXT_213231 [Caerostris extrusa]|uniref:Uncharacterized protein n=1 Tax=Caerostris extrusa TaxID=172846 RepID=A0AAV4Q198_CAEEX|nr:hypothetical protein CEXT_213231 [Caerostris extrusa]